MGRSIGGRSPPRRLLAGIATLTVAMSSLSLRVGSVPEELARDDQPLDLGGALVDPWGPRLPVEPLDGGAAEDSEAPVDLHRLVDHPVGHLGREELRHRGLEG